MNKTKTNQASPNSLMGHLIELRNRLLKSIAAVVLVFISLAYFANDIYHMLRSMDNCCSSEVLLHNFTSFLYI